MTNNPKTVVPDEKRRGVARAVSAMSVVTLSATLSGMFREGALAYAFGTGAVADATAVVIFLVDLTGALFISGGMSFATLPIIVRRRTSGGDMDAVSLVFAMAGWIAALSTIASIAAYLLIPYLVTTSLAPARAADAPIFSFMLRAALPSISLVLVASVIGASLYAFERFTAVHVGRLLWNVSVVAILSLGVPASAPERIALGLFVGSALNVVYALVTAARVGGLPRSLRHPDLNEVARVGIPALFTGIGTMALLGMYERYLLAGQPVGSLATVNYAQRASYMAGTITFAVITVTFTRFTHDVAAGKLLEAMQVLRNTCRSAMLLFVPLAGLMMVERREIIAILFRRGAFDASAVLRTSDVFLFYAITIVPGLIAGLLTRVLYTLQRPWTAIGLQVACAVLAGVTDAVLIRVIGASAIPIGYSVGLIISLMLGYRALATHDPAFARSSAGAFLLSLLIALAGVGAVAARHTVFPIVETGASNVMHFVSLVAQAGLDTALFLTASLVMASLLRVPELALGKEIIVRRWQARVRG